MGSIINAFGTPSRYDNDIAYISPRVGGFQFEGHVAMAEVPNDARPFIYQATEQLRIGALWGKIDDRSGRDRGANGGSIGAYYDLSKRTMLLALVDTLRNETNGGWRPAGSAGLKSTFTVPGDINGRTINGAQVGIVHRF